MSNSTNIKTFITLSPQLKNKLIYLADKYEKEFCIKDDPCQFMHQDYLPGDKEIVALIASSLAFGRRDQIISHVNKILDNIKTTDLSLTNASPLKWIRTGTFRKMFTNSNKSFYRIFSYKDMNGFFEMLRQILLQHNTLGSYYKSEYIKSCGTIPLYKIITTSFATRTIGTKSFSCGTLIPQTETSACKRVQLFLRWMVRGINCNLFTNEICTNSDGTPKCFSCKKNNSTNKVSSVDLALWTWYDKKNLLIPLDTHVIQEAVKFNLLPRTKTGNLPGATLKMAQLLTNTMKTIWPDDPTKGDFALFGLGVDK